MSIVSKKPPKKTDAGRNAAAPSGHRQSEQRTTAGPGRSAPRHAKRDEGNTKTRVESHSNAPSDAGRATPAPRLDTAIAEREERGERERSVWTAMHDFVTGRPQHYAQACDAAGLTPPQASLLRTMEPEAPATMSALAAALCCHASNITGLVDRLEEQGLVERQPSQADRRVKQIGLTPKGLGARAKFCEALSVAPQEFSQLEESELATLERVMKALLGPH
jgi:DNA-binding MarR family transcriptional regulator